MTYLVNVNVWLACALAGHVHHAAAAEWVNGPEAERLVFCRVTQQGLLWLLTNSQVMGANVLPAARAWQVYDSFRMDSRVAFVSEPPGLETAWRALTRHPHSGPNYWTDSYLAAFASLAGYGVVTFDRALARHTGIEVRVLAR